MPLKYMNLPDPVLGPGEILVRVSACGICPNDLDEIEGRTPPPHLPIIPGHQVVGRVAMTMGKSLFQVDDRVGVGWIYSSCGVCRFCKEGNENLCVNFRATGRDTHGGYAQYMRVPEDFAFRLPDTLADIETAALLCDGPVGLRALRLTGIKDGDSLGLFGLGYPGQIILQLVKHLYPHSPISVFSSVQKERATAQDKGVAWTGAIDEEPLAKLDAIIDTTPNWKPVVEALENLDHGGRLIIDASHKDDQDKSQLGNLDYLAHLWSEKEIKSVANVSRRDIQEFLEIAASISLQLQPQVYKLQDANRALVDLQAGRHIGPQVLKID
ncbi:MAG: alcohol dehydrogenase catalytic domain-containing protein [Anaerolineae bacterium]